MGDEQLENSRCGLLFLEDLMRRREIWTEVRGGHEKI